MHMKNLRLDLKWLILVLGALAAACDDPVPPSPQGAASFRIGPRPGKACAQNVPNASIGTVSDTASNQVVDGDGGAQVSCTVSASGNGFVFNVQLTKGNTHFEINGQTPISAGNPVPAQASFVGDGVNSLSSGTKDPCTVELVTDENGVPRSIGAGRIWAKLSCPAVYLSGSGEASTCGVLGVTDKVPGGYFVAENCTE